MYSSWAKQMFLNLALIEMNSDAETDRKLH